jgi:hypothetical protein
VKKLLAALSVVVTAASFAAMIQTAAVQADAATCKGNNQFTGTGAPPKHKANVCTK